MTLAITAGAVLMAVAATMAVAALGHLDNAFPGAPGLVLALGKLASYAVLGAVGAAGAATLYRYAPDRDEARWVWLTPGSVAVTLLWLALTLGFGAYVANFGNYDATYGSLGAVVVLLTWLYLSAYILIMGAELNAELVGAGVLISAVAFDLMDEAYARGGFDSTALGFVGGALAYTVANIAISRRGARHHKRSDSDPNASLPSADAGSGLAIAVGALLDGIPESVVIGVSLLQGTGVSLVTVAAVFLSNVPEGLSSAAGMRRAGDGPGYVFGVWGGIALISGIAAAFGNLALANAPPDAIASVTAVAAGAILAMLVDTMIPEATEQTHEYSGLITVGGFLLAFVLTKLG